MKRLCVFLACLVFVGINLLQAQTVQITGTVTSAEDGMPVPGASIQVKGTSIGISTDLDGKYTISVPQSATALIFSFVGLKTQEVQIQGRTVINVVLESDALALEEIVVTALGIRRETKALGYSVQSVSGDDVTKGGNVNMVNALSARAAGVAVTSSAGAAGASSFIVIRGFSSITQNNQPLFIVDGVPIDNSQLASTTLTAGVAHSNRAIDINPDDIESVNILKGGAATALYGIRAANGAIIITTKKGKNNQRMEVSFSTSTNLEWVSQLPENQSMYAQGSNGAFSSTGTASFGPKISDMRYDGVPTPYYPNGKPIVSSDPNLKPIKAFDNLANFWQTGVTYNNSASVSGGGENSSYYMSFSNLAQEGIIPNNTFNRTTLSVSGETKLSKMVTTSARIAYTNSNGYRIQQGSNTSGVMLALSRMPISYDMAGGVSDPANNPDSYMFSDGSYRQKNAYEGGGYDNPYWTVNRNPFKDNVDRMIGNANIIVTPNDWLSFTYKVGTDFYTDRRKMVVSINSRTSPTGLLLEDQYFRQDFNSDLIANMNFNLTDDLKTNVMIGNNMYQYKYQNIYSEIGGLVIPDYYNLSNTASQSSGENNQTKRTAAFYGDLAFDYKGMFFINGTARKEWSTTLPEANNSFFYPSVSASFILTEIDAVKNVSFLTFAKLRGSYAIIGNDAPIFSTAQLFARAASGDGWTTSAISFPAFGTPGFQISTTLANPELKPETTKTMEFGVDLRFFQNRLGIDVTYFDISNEDLILSVPIASSSGFNFMNANAASMTNKGIEVVLRGTPVQKRDFSWDIEFNFTRLKNEVVELAAGVPSVFLGGFVGKQARAVVGNPYGSIFGNDWRRNEDGKVLIQGDPNKPFYGYPIMGTEDKNIGNVLPDWTLGIFNSFDYKSFRFSFLIDIKQGGKMWNGTRGANINFGMSKETEDRDKNVVFDGVLVNIASNGTVTEIGDNNIAVPLTQAWYSNAGGGFNGPGSPYVESTSWVRLREVSLSYTLPQSISSKAGINHAEVFVTGKNLYLKTPYTGVDPETNLYGASNAQGLDYYNMPGTRSVMLGLRINL